MTVKKHKIVLDLDKDSLMELRRVLFANGVSVQGFLSYVVELVSMRDPRMDEFLVEAIDEKRQRKAVGNSKTTDADTLYHMIEQELQKKTNNGAG